MDSWTISIAILQVWQNGISKVTVGVSASAKGWIIQSVQLG